MKKYLLDTNVISELVKPNPEPRVLEWLEAQQENTLFLSTVTIGELAKGITALKDCKKKDLEHSPESSVLGSVTKPLEWVGMRTSK